MLGDGVGMKCVQMLMGVTLTGLIFHVTLDGLMFNFVSSLSFVVMVICVRAKASVCPRMSDDAIMHVEVKGDVFEFIGSG